MTRYIFFALFGVLISGCLNAYIYDYYSARQTSESAFNQWLKGIEQRHPDIDFRTNITYCSHQDWAMSPGDREIDFNGCKESYILYPRKDHYTDTDEFSLLHEMEHVCDMRSGHLYFDALKKRKISEFLKTMTVLTAGAVLLCKRPELQQTVYMVGSACIFKNYLNKKLSLIADKAVNKIAARMTENSADNFACQKAGYRALLEAAHFFNYHYRFASSQQNILTRWYYDFDHPCSADRCSNIIKAIEQRFGQKKAQAVGQLCCL